MEVPDGFGRDRLARHMGTGRRTIHRRGLGLGRRGPLWGGEVAKIVKDITEGGSLWVFKLHRSYSRSASEGGRAIAVALRQTFDQADAMVRGR